jgi:uncharacterized protein YhaN
MGAEVAEQQRRNAEAEMYQAAREWAVLKTGSVLLAAVLARHRSGRQDPLLQRASSLFATLTGGSFAGIEKSFDDEQEHLLGRRADGGLLPIDGMSEGTRDQLYLALRLAYVEDYASRAEPAPFIGDDLFTSFDDRRTGYGLTALADLGATLQPILFTHHRHVADIARREIGADLDLVTLE